VLDVQALAEDVGVFVAQIKRQFPDLVLLVAGSRETEHLLAISSAPAPFIAYP